MRFRRDALHVRLAREAGLDLDERPPHDATPRWGEAGVHGVARPREWDAVAIVDAPELDGDELAFVALPGGTLLVEEGVDASRVGVLADALDLEPPYRAQAVHRNGTAWAVAAQRIDVATLGDRIEGNELELAVHEGARSLRVDGRAVFGSVPELERLAAGRELEAYVVRAQRLEGDLWQIWLSPL